MVEAEVRMDGGKECSTGPIGEVERTKGVRSFSRVTAERSTKRREDMDCLLRVESELVTKRAGKDAL